MDTSLEDGELCESRLLNLVHSSLFLQYTSQDVGYWSACFNIVKFVRDFVAIPSGKTNLGTILIMTVG